MVSSLLFMRTQTTARLKRLREAMEAHFGFAPTWYIQIMTPVFEPTPIHLYRHPDLIEPAP